MAHTSYPTNNPEPLRALAADADSYLQGQLAAALASDQRALIFAGFLAAAAAAVGSAAVTLTTSSSPNPFLTKLAMCVAAGLLASMFCAAIAARPVKWFFPGSHPTDWQNDFLTDKPEIERLQELLEDYDDRISANHRTMLVNGRWIQASAIGGFLSLFIGGLLLGTNVW